MKDSQVSQDLKEQQDVRLFDYRKTVDDLIIVTKQKKDDLDHQVLLAENQLKQLKESQDRERSLFSVWKREQTDKFQQEMDVRSNKIAEREHALDIANSNIERRLADIKTRELQSLNITDEKAKLDEERIDIQRLRNQISDLRHEVSLKQADISSKFSHISQREITLDNLKKDMDSKNIELSKRESEYIENIKSLGLEKTNLEKLKELVDPKMKDIDFQLKVLDEKNKDIESREKEISRRLEEDRAMIKAIEERDFKVKSRERELDSLEQELNRKALIKNIKVDDASKQ